MKKLIVFITLFAIQLIIAKSGNGVDVQFDCISKSEILLNFNMADYEVLEVEVDGIIYNKIEYSGVNTNKKGYAELPKLHSTFAIDDKNDVVIKSVAGEYSEIKLDYPLLPSRGTIYRNQDPSTIPYEINPESIKDSWYPETLAENTDPFVMRDVRGVNTFVYPIRYNAATQTIRVYKNLSVVISDDLTKSTNSLTIRPDYIDPSMNDVYNSLFINYGETKFANQVGEFGEILVLYTSNNGGLTAIQPYIDWKREKGFIVNATKLRTGINAKTTIANAYTANPNLLYVQLVGDWADIISNTCDVTTDADPMDPDLGYIVGSDLYPEVIIGRFSAESETDVIVQVNKAIDYEKNPEINGSWYKKGLGIGSPDGDGIGDDDEIDYEHIDIIKENKLLAYTYDTINEAYGTPTASTVANYVNAGLGVINYCGHGASTYWVTSSYSNSDVNSSTNGNRLPFIFSVACVNGAFQNSNDCFAEAWLRKSDGGAVATLMSTINQPWQPPMRGQDYMNDILSGGYDYVANPGSGTSTTSSDQRTTFGSIAMNGSILMLAESGDASSQETINTWTIFGDASLQVRTDTPKSIVNTNLLLLPGNYSTKVLFSGNPVEGARVTLYQNGINFTGLTDSEGNVSIDHSFTEDVTITVSGFNLETVQVVAPVVILDGPYIKVNNYSISTNNFGELAFGQFELKNIGIENSTDVNLNVTTESSYVTFSDAIESYGNINMDDSVVVSDCISFEIDCNTPDQEKIEFITQITDNFTKRSYNSKFYITVNSPVINIAHDFGADYLNPGDSKDIIFRIDNTGKADLIDFTVELNQITDYPVNLQSSFNVEILNSESYTDLIFNCSFDSSVPLASSVEFVLIVDNGNGFQVEYEFDIPVGLTETFETGDFSNNDWKMSGVDWTTDNMEVYDGIYSSKSGVITDNQESKMSVEYDFGENGNISFYRKVSSEPNYDFLYFYIDDVEKGKWSREKDWEQYSYPVASGSHELSWSYEKDGSDGNGSDAYLDCAWIDNILASGIISGIESLFENTPNSTILYKNYPNPFNPSTEIKFYLANRSNVKLTIFNANGQLVRELLNRNLSNGLHLMKFNAGNLNSGVYYYVLETENSKLSEKMLLIK